MSLGTLISRVFGLIRDVLIMSGFDKAFTDLFVVAFRLPNLFRRLLGEGALAVSFVPTYLSLDEKKRKDVAHIMFTFLTVLTASLVVLGVIYMEQVVGLITSGERFSPGSGSFDIAVFYARVMFVYLFLVTQFAFFMSLLNANKEFFIPGLAPAFFNLGFILLLLLPTESFFVSNDVMAFGVVFGGGLQAGCVLIKAWKMKLLPKFNFSFRNSQFLKILLKTLPAIAGLGIAQLMGLVNIKIVSGLEGGGLSAIYLGDRLLELPQSLIAISLGTVLLTQLSGSWAKSNTLKFEQDMNSALRIFLFLALPCACAFIFYSQALISLIFGYGKLDGESIFLVSQILQFYSVVLIFNGMNKILIPSFFAAHNTWFPPLTSFIVLSLHCVLAYVLSQTQMGVLGVVASMAVMSCLSFSINFIGFRSLIFKLKILESLKMIYKLLLPLMVMSFFLYSVQFYSLESSSKMIEIITTFLSVGAGASIYFALTYFLKVPECLKFFQGLKSKLFPRAL